MTIHHSPSSSQFRQDWSYGVNDYQSVPSLPDYLYPHPPPPLSSLHPPSLLPFPSPMRNQYPHLPYPSLSLPPLRLPREIDIHLRHLRPLLFHLFPHHLSHGSLWLFPIFSTKVLSDISFISSPLNQQYENSPSARKRPESGWHESLHGNQDVHFNQLGHYFPSLRMRNPYPPPSLGDSLYPSLLLADYLYSSPPSPPSSLPLLSQPLVSPPMRNCYPFLRSKSAQISSISDSLTLKNHKNLKLE
ncbi:hypothetical protein KY290_001331 [Solanum tuberosum]|uniref:Uncharacterized protein n=1 Tax=Solanum tuberosum TaxID=4113 RepID=A0ABQ7WLX1_SOLTU|nr:hypothetical protein KY290_001331 [Solanum tuberosum]